VRAIFEAPTTTPRERKQLLRALIAEVVVTVVNGPKRTAHVTIIWEGGATTEFKMTRRPPEVISEPPTRTPSISCAASPAITMTAPSR
jgi:hypothetical protein